MRKKFLLKVTGLLSLVATCAYVGADAITDVEVFTGVSSHKDVNDFPYKGTLTTGGVPAPDQEGNFKDTVKTRTWDFGVGIKSLIDDAVYVNVGLRYGKVGKPKEHYYDNYKSMNVIDEKSGTGKSKGNIFDCVLKVGYKFDINDNISIIPFAGWKYCDKKIKSYLPNVIQGIEGGERNMSWNGPQVGFQVPFSISDEFSLSLDCSYGFLSYKASIKKGENYVHAYEAKKRMGSAFAIGLNGKYDVNEDWSISLGYSFDKMSSKPEYTKSDFIDANTKFESASGLKGKVNSSCHKGVISVVFNF